MYSVVFRPLVLVISVLLLSACSSMYYGAMEKVGIHKRDILVDRVEDAKDAQSEAKTQFASALEQFQSVVTIEDQTLVDKYNSLNDEYEASKAAAEDVSDRIDAVEDVSEALFDEWQDELAL